MSGVLQVLRDILREHEWDFENALGSLLLFSSESGKIKKKKIAKFWLARVIVQKLTSLIQCIMTNAVHILRIESFV